MAFAARLGALVGGDAVVFVSKSRRGACAVLALFVSLAFCAPASAQGSTDDELARNYFNLGTAQLDRGDYEAAVRSFEEAHRLSRRPALLFNLYVAYERLGNLEAAIDHLSRFLASGEPVENRAALDVRLENLRRRLEARRTGLPEVVDEPATAVPEEPRDPSSPTETAAPSTAATPAESEPETDESAEPAAAETSTVRLAPLLVWSSAGAAGVSFTVAALLARSEDQRLERACHEGFGPTCTSAEVAGLRRRNITADVSLGLTIGLATAALVLQLTGGGDEAPVAVLPLVERSALGVSAGGRF